VINGNVLIKTILGRRFLELIKNLIQSPQLPSSNLANFKTTFIIEDHTKENVKICAFLLISLLIKPHAADK
jgi:hypothetical protein